MIDIQFRYVFSESELGGAVTMTLENARLTAASTETGRIQTYDLGQNIPPSLVDDVYWTGAESDHFPKHIEQPADGTIWLWSHFDGRVLPKGHDSVVMEGGAALEISAVVGVAGGGVLVGLHDQDQLALIAETQGTFKLSSTFTDTAKTSISDLSDLISISVGGSEYVIASSYVKSGLTSMTTTGSELHAVDTIGEKDGLWVAGINKLGACEVDGQTYVLALSSTANTMVSLRLNDLGVFFPADQFWDDKETRFFGATDFDLFEWRGRDFLVTGGQDLGLSLIEILPGGVFFHHGSIAQSVQWSLGPVTQLEVEVVGDEAQIFVAGSQGDGIAQLFLDLSHTGERYQSEAGGNSISGGWMDEVLIGGDGNDFLDGKAGDDVLIDGAGADVLFGDNGADIFVFQADGQTDKIRDFVAGEDRISLAGWGRIYDHTALDIQSTNWGARIVWRDETLEVFSKNGRPLEVSDWGADDFIF